MRQLGPVAGPSGFLGGSGHGQGAFAGALQASFSPYAPSVLYGSNQHTISMQNAPTIHLCPTCQQEICDDEEAIQCGAPRACGLFYHRECVQLSKTAWKLLREEPFAEWVCNKCYLDPNKRFDLVQHA